MANAPTRPPGHHRNAGRPPKGPRTSMATKATALINQLTAASARLREVGSDDLAEAVDLALTPQGWSLLRRAQTAAKGTLAPNAALGMSAGLRDSIKAAAQAAGNLLADDVAEGINAFVAGTFTPPEPVRASRGTAEPKTNLNVRIATELRTAAEQAATNRADELGYTANLTHIATSWLVHKYGLQAASKTTPAK